MEKTLWRVNNIQVVGLEFKTLGKTSVSQELIEDPTHNYPTLRFHYLHMRENKPTPPNKYKVVHFIRRLSGDLHFARSGICFNHSTHRPCFPLFPTPIISKDKPGVYNCKIKTTLTPEYWSLTKNTEQWLKMYHSSWFFMLSQAFVLIFKQLTRNRNALISGLHGQFLAHATSLNCASKKKKKKQQIPLNPCRYWGTAFLFQTLK